MFLKLQREVEALVDEVISIAYFMRGSISYDDIMYRTPGERQRIQKFIEKRLKIEEKKMFPVY